MASALDLYSGPSFSLAHYTVRPPLVTWEQEMRASVSRVVYDVSHSVHGLYLEMPFSTSTCACPCQSSLPCSALDGGGPNAFANGDSPHLGYGCTGRYFARSR